MTGKRRTRSIDPTLEEWLGPDNDLGMSIWKEKYQHGSESFSEWLDRVSGGDCKVRKLIAERKFLPAGRVLASRGTKDKKVTYSNCFPSGLRVLTKRGYVPIEEVLEGDMVLTHTGKWQRVNATMSREYEGDLYKIVPLHGKPILCTPEHPFYTKRGWVKASELNLDPTKARKDRLITPTAFNFKEDVARIRIRPTPEELLPQEEIIDCDGDKFRIRTHFCVTRPDGTRYESHKTSAELPNEIKVTDEFAYFIGVWFGDGCATFIPKLNSGVLQIVFNATLDENAALYCEALGTNYLGIPNSKRYTEQNIIALRWQNKFITRAFAREFGQGCMGKKIPEYLMGNLYFNAGFLDSDGSVLNAGDIAITLKSHTLIQQLKDSLELCGVNVSNIKILTKHVGGRISISIAEAADLIPLMFKKNRITRNESYELRNQMRIRNIEVIPDSKCKVYNISVEEDNSYVVEGKVVHNCYVLSAEDSLESIYDTAKEAARTYSYGGGVGIDLSNLAPRGAKVNNAADTSSGAVSFGTLFETTTALIGQHGRRGALMLSLSSDHPDIEEFISAKNEMGQLTSANMSIRASDRFMTNAMYKAPQFNTFMRHETGEMISKEVVPNELLKTVAHNAWMHGEPGVLFWDNITSSNLMSEYSPEVFKLSGVNPCVRGDTMILTREGYIPIEELTDREIDVWNGFEWSTVTPRITGYNQPMLHIEFSDGTFLDCTPYHKIPIADRNDLYKVEARDLRIGDRIQKCEFPTIGKEEFRFNSLMYTYGVFQGDGSRSHRNNGKRCPQIYLYGNKKKILPYLSVRTVNKKEKWICTLDCPEDVFEKRFVPFDEDMSAKLSWLAGYIDTDGTCNSEDGSITIASIDRDMLYRVKLLLNTMGCQSFINDMHGEGMYMMPDGRGGKKEYFRHKAYRLCISAWNVRHLLDLGLPLKRVEVNCHPNRNAQRFVTVTSISEAEDAPVVYCMNEPKNHTFVANGILTGNCAETALPAYGSCNLGSLNLAEFVASDGTFQSDAFGEAVRVAIRALDDILTEGQGLHPLPEQRQAVLDWRQVGLGVMGFADLLIGMGIRYGSSRSLEIAEHIGKLMILNAIRESAQLAKERGPFDGWCDCVLDSPFFDEIASLSPEGAERMMEDMGAGLRNSFLLAIAPTGSIATMLGVSTGIEPLFALEYERRTKSIGDSEQTHKVVPASVRRARKSGVGEDALVTAHDIPWKERVDMQAMWQRFIDASISSTVNLPNSATPQDVYDLYMYAWKKGCKGVTVFRDGCARDAILTTKEDSAVKAAEDAVKEMDEIMEGYEGPLYDDQTRTQIYLETLLEKRIEEYRAKGQKSASPEGDRPTDDGDLVGFKRKLMTGCGSLHCNIFVDQQGNLREVFLSKGSTGGCNNFMIGLSRMISLAARNDIPVADIIDQLNSCGACPSYSVRRATKGDTSKGACCPMAVGNAIQDVMKAVNAYRADTGQIRMDRVKVEPTPEVQAPFTCPTCGAQLVFESGCSTCRQCGWSRCS